MDGVDLGAVWARALENSLNGSVPSQQRAWLVHDPSLRPHQRHRRARRPERFRQGCPGEQASPADRARALPGVRPSDAGRRHGGPDAPRTPSGANATPGELSPGPAARVIHRTPGPAGLWTARATASTKQFRACSTPIRPGPSRAWSSTVIHRLIHRLSRSPTRTSTARSPPSPTVPAEPVPAAHPGERARVRPRRYTPQPRRRAEPTPSTTAPVQNAGAPGSVQNRWDSRGSRTQGSPPG